MTIFHYFLTFTDQMSNQWMEKTKQKIMKEIMTVENVFAAALNCTHLPVNICYIVLWQLMSLTSLPHVFISIAPSRVQPRLLPLPPGLCEVVSARLHVRAAAPQPFSGKLGGLVLRPGLLALQPSLPHLHWHWTHRLPVLPTSQPPGPDLLFAPEPGPA